MERTGKAISKQSLSIETSMKEPFSMSCQKFRHQSGKCFRLLPHQPIQRPKKSQ